MNTTEGPKSFHFFLVFALILTFAGFYPAWADSVAVDSAAATAVRARIKDIESAVLSRDAAAVPRFPAQLQTEPAPSVRAAIVRAIGALSGPRALPTLRGALADSNPEVRMAAVSQLGVLASPQAESALISALSDSIGGMRQSAVFYLGKFKNSRSAAALSRELTRDADPSVRIQAIRSLREIGTGAALSAIKSDASEKDPAVLGVLNSK